MKLLQFGDRVSHARILSCNPDHCLLLTINHGDFVAIRSGFGSGYSGAGSRSFSQALQMLEFHGADIEEVTVDQELLNRLDASSLTEFDIDKIANARPRRPSRWHDYIFEDHWTGKHRVWDEFPRIIPFALVDSRLADLVVGFWDSPDEKLLTGYRRLEDLVRKRTNSDQHGQRLFADAFIGPDSSLYWPDHSDSERTGRGQLFVAAYMAYRNPRAHRELRDDANQHLTEFLLLNHLFLLEAGAVLREP